MKNVKVVKFDLTYQDVIFCYGRKAYRRVIYDLTGSDDTIVSGGRCTRLAKDGKIKYIVGVCKPGKNIHITSIKALWVHELSHLTSMIIEDTNIHNDEFRSHVIQWSYEELIPWVDRLYSDGLTNEEI